jgi:hypothetical protein
MIAPPQPVDPNTFTAVLFWQNLAVTQMKLPESAKGAYILEVETFEGPRLFKLKWACLQLHVFREIEDAATDSQR